MESCSLSTDASTSNTEFKKVFPGDRLFAISEDLRAGIGTYELFGHIYASLAGIVHVLPGTECSKEVRTVEVRKNNEIQHHIVPYIGGIVTAKVLNIGVNFAKCGIVCVDTSMLSHQFSAVLRREDISSDQRDKIQLAESQTIIFQTELYMCIQPGDVILARVIGFGESQTTFVLSIAEDELGVVSGKGDHGERMIPCSFTHLKSTLTNDTQTRKIAKIPNLNSQFAFNNINISKN
ncbi:unnamed protein product [Anisakis simplex]|uniref:Exosome complex component CSL4 (inferred by orthology to a human protein) n=1 Tax=Anisakis simplex TaxID=6269 RepID=A0A0M3K2D1_ANISI|nr:unnamed protein product [Anisakis simplex]